MDAQRPEFVPFGNQQDVRGSQNAVQKIKWKTVFQSNLREQIAQLLCRQNIPTLSAVRYWPPANGRRFRRHLQPMFRHLVSLPESPNDAG
jgi:hypothetical protein